MDQDRGVITSISIAPDDKTVNPTPEPTHGRIANTAYQTYKQLANLNNGALDTIDNAAEIVVGTVTGIANILATSTLGMFKLATGLLRINKKD